MTKLLIILLILIYSPVVAQTLTPEQKLKLKQFSITIDRDKEFEDSNWNSISDVLKDKKLVLIGEFNHGSKEIFEIRNSLIKYLHQKHNFDVILFEAGMGELITPNLEKDLLTPEQMTFGFFGGWRTKEFVELMKYIRHNDLQIAGFDVQRFGRSFHDVLSDVASTHIPDSSLYFNLENQYTEISRSLRQGDNFNSLTQVTDNLIEGYQKVYNVLSDQNNNSPKFLLTRKTLLNRIAYLEYFLQFNKDGNWSKRWAARDSAMADNINWLSQNIFKGKKMIVIAHNFHVSRYNEKELVMGEILSSKYGNEMYSIGIFAGSGSFSNNSGEEENLTPPDSTHLDIKHIISAVDSYASFIDLSDKRTTYSSIFNEKITVNDTFIDLYGTDKMALSRHFDGVLLLKSVSPPRK